MYRRSSFFVRFLALLLLLALLAIGGVALYRLGFSQGYAQAALAAEGQPQQISPALPWYPGAFPPAFGYFPFLPLGVVIGWGLLLFLTLGALFRVASFSHPYWAHPGAGPYPGRPHGFPHWATPPWANEKPSTGSEPEGSAQSEAQTKENS